MENVSSRASSHENMADKNEDESDSRSFAYYSFKSEKIDHDEINWQHNDENAVDMSSPQIASTQAEKSPSLPNKPLNKRLTLDAYFIKNKICKNCTSDLFYAKI